MAEFITHEEGHDMFASKGKGNAGLTLGIIGTALGALNGGWLNGNGILGLGGNRGNGINGTTLALGAAEMGTDAKLWELNQRLHQNEINDVYQIQQSKIDAVREDVFMRERDVAEKGDIYRQTVVDNNRLADKIGELKDFSIKGLSDVYSQTVRDNKEMNQIINQNQMDSMKADANLYNTVIRNDKDLELKMDAHREIDIREKFDMYKEFENKTSKLAYDNMRQSYEDRLETFNQMSNLSNRICALETATAVNHATQPLLFKLSEARTDAALNTKITGNLGIKWDQIYGPNPPFVCGCNCGN